MKVTVEYYAALREKAGLHHEELETEARTALDLYRELQARYGFKLDTAQLMVAINDEHCKIDAKLAGGDLVVFIPPVSGG